MACAAWDWVKWAGMAGKKKKPKPASKEPPRIYEAELASGPSGAVLKGAEIDMVTAIMRRQAGLDIVVCGDDVKANGRIAKQIEVAVGSYKAHIPHDEAGPHALPHFPQRKPPPKGHAFYETGNPQRKARKSS